MRIIRNRRKDGNSGNIHEVINEVIIELCNESMREDTEPEEESIEDLLESCGSPAEDLAYEIISAVADRAGKSFEEMVDGMSMEHALEMISLIENECPVCTVSILQGMFYAYGIEHAAKDLGNIAICSRYCEDA